MEWWQYDVTYGVIRLLEAVGLATKVRIPTEKQKEKLAW